MKPHTSFHSPGIWNCFDSNGRYLGQIYKWRAGWQPTFGYYRCSAFNTLSEARNACL